jgi:hypothetical protein
VRERNAEQVLTKGVRDLGGMALKLAPTTAGLPDRLLLLPGGRVVLVEMKSEKGKRSPIQVHLHGKAAGIGHPVVTLYGMADTRRFLELLRSEGHRVVRGAELDDQPGREQR